MEPFIPYLIIAAGLFALCGGAFGWDFFLDSRKARIWVKMLGRNGARIFYGLLGLAVVVLGIVLAVVGPGGEAAAS